MTGQLSGVVQVPRRCLGQYQKWCRYPADALVSVRSGAVTSQVPWPVPEVVQVPCRCPGQCQEWCRYLAGALASVRSGAGTLQVPWPVSEISLLSLLTQRFIRKLSACTRVPHREGNFIGVNTGHIRSLIL